MPRNDEGGSLDDNRPDRRYWWMQLHRLIASKAKITPQMQPRMLAALERLAEGEFEMEWEASIFAFWTDASDHIRPIGYWQSQAVPEVTVHAYAIGGAYVKTLATTAPPVEISWAEIDQEGEQINVVDITGNESLEMENEEEWDVDESDDYENGEATNQEVLIEDAEPVTATVYGSKVIPATPAPHSSGPAVANDFENDENIAGGNVQPQPENVSSTMPWASDRILIGQRKSGEPVYWEFNHPELTNRHMLIFGASGQGKTYAIQALLCEMSRFKQHSLIVDYTDGFRPDHLENETKKFLNPRQHVVSNNPLPINPFIAQSSDSGGLKLSEKPGDVATRVASLFNAVYNIGDQQRSVLYEAIKKGVELLGSEMNLSRMLELVDDVSEDTKYKSSGQKLYSKVKPFVDKEPFASGNESFEWDGLFQSDSELCHVFQLAGMDSESGRLITEFILWDLYGNLQAKGKKTDPKVLVLDEVQNLDHSEGSPLSKYLREGRKFGVSLILATQILSGMKKDEQDRMFNAAHKLFFKPTDTELDTFASLAAKSSSGSVQDWRGKLASLQKGECYSVGSILNQTTGMLMKSATKVRVSSLAERGFSE